MPGRWTTRWTQDPVQVAVNAAAAARLTRLWLHDDLPPLPRLRAAIAKGAARYQETHNGAEHPLLPLTYCAWCSGFWVSAAVVALASSPLAPLWRPVALALAYSATTGLADQHAEH
jgi:hypothetical protein